MKLKVLSVLLFACLVMSAVSAENCDNSSINSDSLESNDTVCVLGNSNEDEQPDVPDLIVDENHYVYSSNLDSYFKNGVLDKKFEGETLIFSGDFKELGVLTINRQNVNIIGQNATFKNTVFNIENNNVFLKNITFILDKSIKSNNGAVISVSGSDITLDSLTINYIVPSDVEAYAIFADGGNNDPADNLKILNSDIYFEGHNDNVDRYNCAIKLVYANSILIENNTIRTSLPLKNIKYGLNGATLDSNFVYTIGLEECHDFIINNNLINSNVNKRTAVQYPTLDGIMLSKSDNGIFSNNSVYMTDFVTFPGVENYLYGLDVHNLDNLLVVNNTFSIITTGGKLGLGTAYPIQVNGPAMGINITQNDLYSFSNGPNIGIYSQNYYGPTDISITNNKINVTGLAGTHEWALVAGIESQDTNAEILNNVIEVHSVDAVNVDDNIYAISYRQSTDGTHTYNIQNNVAFSDGYYAVYLLSSQNSEIINNILISFNNNAETGSDSYKEGYLNHDGDKSRDNIVINAKDYYGSKNEIYIDFNVNSVVSNIIYNQNAENTYNQQIPNYNPLIPSSSNYHSNPNNNQGSKNDLIDGEYRDEGSIQGTISDFNGDVHESKVDSDVNGHDVNDNSVNVYSDGESNGLNNVNGNLNSNNTQTPSLSGNEGLFGQSQSSGSGQSKSVSKSFELNELNKEEFIPSIFFIIVLFLLFAVGYRFRNNHFD